MENVLPFRSFHLFSFPTTPSSLDCSAPSPAPPCLLSPTTARLLLRPRLRYLRSKDSDSKHLIILQRALASELETEEPWSTGFKSKKKKIWVSSKSPPFNLWIRARTSLTFCIDIGTFIKPTRLHFFWFLTYFPQVRVSKLVATVSLEMTRWIVLPD